MTSKSGEGELLLKKCNELNERKVFLRRGSYFDGDIFRDG